MFDGVHVTFINTDNTAGCQTSNLGCLLDPSDAGWGPVVLPTFTIWSVNFSK